MIISSKQNSLLASDALIAIALTVVCLLPFVNKAYHVDDTLFLWVADHIRSHPFDFYGFSANWYGADMSMAEINQNPPLVSYFIALISLIFGGHELTLHLAFILPAVCVIAGTYQLAKQLGGQPLLAALSTLFTPVFLISSTNVMSDVLMLAFYVWAITLWIRGLADRNGLHLGLSALFIALAALTKYFGVTLIPLLIVYTVASQQRLSRTLFFFIIPLVILAGYQWYTHALYGYDHLSSAVSYSLTLAKEEWTDPLAKNLTGLAFAGGGVASAFFFTPLLWRGKHVLFGGSTILGLLVLLLISKGTIYDVPLIINGQIRWSVIIQFSIYILAGLQIVLIALLDFGRRRDASALLLLLWVLGTFTFATYFNWTTSGRTILPMAPAVAVLVTRRLGSMRLLGKHTNNDDVIRFSWWALAPAACLALTLAWADYGLANTQRIAARAICHEVSQFGKTIWFQGHWGFQYYMENADARALSYEEPTDQVGDYLVVPEANTSVQRPPSNYSFVKTYEFQANPWITTMARFPVGAGFYSARIGPLPFVIGIIPPEEFKLYRMERQTPTSKAATRGR